MTWWMQRILWTLGILWAIGTLAFALIHLIPGDPVIAMLGENAAPAEIESVRHAWGLDRPLPVRYVEFWLKWVRGDWGTSFRTRRPIRPEILDRLKNSALLAICAVLWTSIVSLPLGSLAAVRPRWDRWITPLTSVGIALPSFVIAPFLMYVFAVQLHWLPVSGYGSWRHLILPTLTLSTGMIAYLTRITRTSIRETLDQPFVWMAWAKGLPRVLWWRRHVWRPSAVPIVTVMGLQLGALLTGTVITETIFAWPGLGRYFIQSIYARDYPAVQACVILFGAAYAGVNLCVDLIYHWLDPRTR